jgi:hypothetical protein
MKRELGTDLHATFFPAFEADVVAFVADLARRLGDVYDDAAAAVDRERVTTRAASLDPIERALAISGDPAARAAERTALAHAIERLAAIEVTFGAAEAVGRRTDDDAVPERAGNDASSPSAAEPTFDADAYDRALRPERYRVVVLGALRRGKTSLINAIAGTRLLQDDGASEALFPIHVRYGERARAYTLTAEGTWTEIATTDAMARAAIAPVLIETPWSMPRELVLVHAPAFDSGSDAAETIALAAARAGSEIVGLFSRQLSDRELALYGRVAAFEKPMLLAHTIADNETAAERRTVVDLAARYVRERGIDVSRIFTISALEYLEAAQTKRAPAGWNELAALRDTLRAHAEEHMSRADARRRAMASEPSPAVASATAGSSRPNLRTALDRLFGRSAP